MDIPEVNVVIFSFLLHFVWEMWQVPFYTDVPMGEHWRGVIICTLATLGDVILSLVAFWTTAAWTRKRSWILSPDWRNVTVFLAVGLLVIIVFEALSTGIWNLWDYSPIMPTLPIIGTGLVPLLQWLVIPPLVIWFVCRRPYSNKGT